jgi:tetratricopeptide (TPR) repeat protein
LARNLLAWASCRAGKQKKHLDYLVNTVQQYRKAGADPLSVTFGARLGECYLLNHQYEAAKEQIEITLKTAERAGLKYYAAWCHHLLGEALLKSDPSREKARFAETCFECAVSICRKIRAENSLAVAYAGLGRCHKHQGNAAVAREYLNRALEIFQRLGTLLEPDNVRKEMAQLPEG